MSEFPKNDYARVVENPYYHLVAEDLILAAETIRYCDKMHFSVMGNPSRLYLCLGDAKYSPMGVSRVTKEQADALTKAFREIIAPCRERALQVLEDALAHERRKK